MIKKYFLVPVIFFTELFAVKFWLSCHNFSDLFHFSYTQANLKLAGAVHNDIGFPTLLVRIFHNKAVIFGNQLLVNYLHFWDIRYGILQFSIVGYFGIICGYWYLLKRKNIYKLLLFIVLLLIPLIEVFSLSIPYQARLFVLTFPYQLLSLYGIVQFIAENGKKAFWILILLLIISIWYQIIFQNDIFINCLKI